MPRLALALAILLTACSAPEVRPATAEVGAVGLEIQVYNPARHRWEVPLIVYFVRVVEDADPTRVGRVIHSNHRYGDSFYLLNAEPGRYAAVASYEEREGRRYTTYFPAEFIRNSVVDVEAGRTVVMGEARMDATTLTASRDDAQMHYFRVTNAKLVHSGSLSRVLGRDQVQWGKTRGFVGR